MVTAAHRTGQTGHTFGAADDEPPVVLGIHGPCGACHKFLRGGGPPAPTHDQAHRRIDVERFESQRRPVTVDEITE